MSERLVTVEVFSNGSVIYESENQPLQAQSMEYFGKHLSCRSDNLNEAIWRQSPFAQRCIQNPARLIDEGSIGAQQAMMPAALVPGVSPATILPWVPDILGEHWKSANSMIVVGTAYAGFIRELSGRARCLDLSQYARLAKESWPEFQDHFLDEVVAHDSNYYAPIETLVGGIVDFSQLALFDLCRASFVKRGSGRGQRADSPNQNNIKVAPDLFSDYVEWEGTLPDGSAYGPGVWTWGRIAESKASCIVALGHVAEHGLLRMFARKLTGSTISLRTRPEMSPRINLKNKRWPNAYANRGQQLSAWDKGKTPDWWCVSGTVNGTIRRWSVFSTYHPARTRDDAYYATARARLRAMWEESNA